MNHSDKVMDCMDSSKPIDFVSKFFNFSEVLKFLEKFGRQQFGQNFMIHKEDHSLIFKLLIYFFNDQDQCIRAKISLDKGILLSGPVGCGKTTLLSMMRYILPPEQQHVIISTRKIAFEFGEHGFPVIQKYSNKSFYFNSDKWVPKTFCFDDLGVESEIKHYGNKCNIMAEIILSRYDLFKTHNMLTHITTNLSASEIEKYYGNRLRSRLREMVNVISFNNDTPDKRK